MDTLVWQTSGVKLREWGLKHTLYPALPQAWGKICWCDIFLFFLYVNKALVYSHKSKFNPYIDIVAGFLPNTITFVWIFLMWGHFFPSYAILPPFPIQIFQIIFNINRVVISWNGCCIHNWTVLFSNGTSVDVGINVYRKNIHIDYGWA